jgi:hypothetical protein
MNPTEKSSKSNPPSPLLRDESATAGFGGQTGSEAEPVWIRDVMAASIDIISFDPSKVPIIVAGICEGEKSYCEYCGAEASLWPTKQWADHILTAHGDNLTIQTRTGTSMMCEDSINHAQQVFFSMMLSARVSMRRRAWKRGLVVVKQPEGLVKLSN